MRLNGVNERTIYADYRLIIILTGRTTNFEYNDIKLKYNQEALVNLGLGTAKGDYKQEHILQWILEHKITYIKE